MGKEAKKDPFHLRALFGSFEVFTCGLNTAATGFKLSCFQDTQDTKSSLIYKRHTYIDKVQILNELQIKK